MNVQYVEQPSTLNPVQSSDEAKKARGIAADNSIRDTFGKEFVAGPAARFQRQTASAAMTSSQKGAPSKRFVSAVKSTANLTSSKAERHRPARNSQG